MPAFEPGKIRNVAVVGHRGTGKTSLVEALLFQAGETNRLGTIDAGSTIADWDDDEQQRRMSISLSLTHAEWQGRKLNLIDVPGDPSFQGEARCSLRVVEGALFVLSGVMGVEVGTSRRLEAGRRARDRARALREHARPRARRLLPCARSDAGAALAALRRGPSADRDRARADGDRRRAAHVRVHEPGGREGARAGADPRRAGRPRPGVPREAARRGRPDRRGADGEVPRRRRARRRGGRARAQGRGHARRGLPGRVRRRDEEPRHARAPRPDRRRCAVAGEGGLDHAHRGRRDGRVRLQDDRRPVRRPDQPLPRPAGLGQARPDPRRCPHAREGADGLAALPAGQGAHPGGRVRARGHRCRREAERGADRRSPARQGGRDGRARDRVSRAGDELRRHAEVEGRRGEGGARRSAGWRRRIRPCGSAATSRPGRRSSPG